MLEKRRYIGSCQTHLLLGFEWRYRGGGGGAQRSGGDVGG